ncbi:kinase-like protein [Agrocybe pediades]|nr:kinase-like protein [Agrocybe pediades]
MATPDEPNKGTIDSPPRPGSSTTTVPTHPVLSVPEKEAKAVVNVDEVGPPPNAYLVTFLSQICGGMKKSRSLKKNNESVPLDIQKLHGMKWAKYHARFKIARHLRYPRYGNVFVLLDGRTVAKVGKLGDKKCRVRLQEARTMDFIARNTTIPVPRVYGVYEYRGYIHIVQERVPGNVLQDVWSTLSAEDKQSLMEQLRGYLDQLRSLEPPRPGRVEAVDGGAVIDERLFPHEYGPFNSPEEFNDYIYHDYVRERPEMYPDLVEPLKKIAGRRWKTKFSHGDLGTHNIMWKGGRITGIIDWERSGWFPEYWEYTRVRAASLGEFWDIYRAIAGQYPDELAVEELMSGYFVRV